ncbi:hypothetical protein [Chryseobacterium sp. SL1]|uniref:hypothetical protein n=1 Tax=Chryseobacterium sp. SL1 TaxID=2995159 RepID=UPI002273B763|nr:hypothetical protein [Chryseobacterium sp. SL1]MCY1660129.1 hypothetical protein [Chryseobacterium sp. SL1]
MIQLTKQYIDNNGGYLHSLRKKSALYIQNLLKNEKSIQSNTLELNKLDRTISHAHPHLDEYFADLLFRSCLPEHKMDIDFMEMSIQSQDNDSACKAYWPNAVVYGIGSMAAGGADAICLFDEHQEKGEKSVASSSQMVKDKLMKKYIPSSVFQVLWEVNELDSSGAAHNQHISNIIKTAHQVRFMFKKDKEYYKSIQDWLSPEWKKSIMDAAITSVIYCLENRIDLINNPDEKTECLRKSLKHYSTYSPFKEDKIFNEVITYFENNYIYQKGVFNSAQLAVSKKDQLLLLGRVCFAMEHCWGEKTASIIMMHFWEILYQGQAAFMEISSELEQLKNGQTAIHSKYGIFHKKEIDNHRIKAMSAFNLKLKKDFEHVCWIMHGDQTPIMLMGNRPLINFLNRNNSGFGIVFLEDSFSCTKAIFKGPTFPQRYWEKLVDLIYKREPEAWHKTLSMKTGDYAPFLINGNRSHQYVPVSELNVDDLEDLLKKLS